MPKNIYPIRVLIVEDSQVCLDLLKAILSNDTSFEIVGVARNGLEAVSMTKSLQPDIVTMDINMPQLDGLEATRRIMEEDPRPIVMVTSSLDRNESDLTFRALQAGALSIIKKPTVNDSPEMFALLVDQVKLMSEVKVVRRWPKGQAYSRNSKPIKISGKSKANLSPQIELIAIAASTGGPGALATILQQLPANFPIPILVVQHIADGFGESLVSWLNQQTSLSVTLATNQAKPQAGDVLVAPANYHMTLTKEKMVSIDQNETLKWTSPCCRLSVWIRCGCLRALCDWHRIDWYGG